MSIVFGVWVKTLISNRARWECCAYLKCGGLYSAQYRCTLYSVMYRACRSEAQSTQSRPPYRPRLATGASHIWQQWPGADRGQTIEVTQVTDQSDKRCISLVWVTPAASAGPSLHLSPWHTDLQSYPHENAGRVTQSALCLLPILFSRVSSK